MNANNHRRSLKALVGGLILTGLTLTAAVGQDELSLQSGYDTVAASIDKVQVSDLTCARGPARFPSVADTGVTALNDALSKIDRINPVSFDEPPQHGGRRRLGFTLHELAVVLPEAVHLGADGLPYAVDPGALIPVTVQSIRELRAENAALRAENSALRAEIEMLRARMERMEQALKAIPRCGMNDPPIWED